MTATNGARKPSVRGVRTRPATEWAAALVIALLPFTLPFNVVLKAGSDDDAESWIFFPLDLGLAVILVVGTPSLISKVRGRQARRSWLLLAALTGLTAIAAVVNLEAASAQFAGRMAAVAVLVMVLGDLGPRMLQGPVSYTLAIVGVEQSLLAIGQAITGRPLGLAALGLGELPSLALPLAGGVTSVRGTLFYPYMLAGFSVLICTIMLAGTLLSHRRSLFWVLSMAAAVPIGLTYSRMSVLAVFGLAAVLLLAGGPRRRNAIGLAAVLSGALIPAALTFEGWLARGQQTVAATDAESVSSGRIMLVRQAWMIIKDAPIFGVGPGNYTDVLAQTEPDTPYLLPVHNVPLLVAAEAGVLAGLMCVALLCSLGMLAWQSGVASRSLYCAILPFLFLDVIPYRTPQGIVMFGLWIGAVMSVASVEQSNKLPAGGANNQGVPDPGRRAAISSL